MGWGGRLGVRPPPPCGPGAGRWRSRVIVLQLCAPEAEGGASDVEESAHARPARAPSPAEPAT